MAVCGVALSQSYKAYSEKAEEAVAAKNYSAALSYYHFLVTEAGRASIDNYYRAAESARQFRVYSLAEEYYQRVANEENGPAKHPRTNFWLADVEKRQGKYHEAKAHYEAFLLGGGTADSTFAQKARKEIDDCNWALALTKDPDDIDIEHLDAPVNSEMTDLAPVKHKGNLYFTSIRDNINNTKLDSETGSVWIQRIGENIRTLEDISLTSIMVQEGDSAALSQYDAFREDTLHVAHVAIAEKGKRVVYTLCKSVNFTESRCKLYYRDLDDQGRWGPKVALPNNINRPGYTATQPAIGRDRAANKTLLVFASDRPGGMGKMDLWCTYINDDNTFDDPVPLSATFGAAGINTPENDITPFWDEATQTLYFSSEGHQNMGSYDIYKVEKDGHSWGQPQHLGYPTNSSYDDVYYSISDDGREAFFSSNRPGSFCASEDSICTCNDIYKLTLPGIKLKVLTYNEITKEPLHGVRVDLANQINNEEESQNKDDDFRYDYGIDFEQLYNLVGTKDGYTADNEGFSTQFERKDTTIQVELYLRPAVDLNTLTFDKKTGEPLPGVQVDLQLMPLVETLESQRIPSTHQYHYPLNFKRSYRVVATKSGYTSDTVYVSTEDIPVVPTTLLRKLYLCKGLDPFPDISIYFDNDHPDPDRTTVSTKLTYDQTCTAYLDNRKDYESKLNKGSNAYYEMKSFFDNDVEGGLTKLNNFAQRIYDYFSTVNSETTKVRITIRGHASLRSNSTYNLALTKRRVSSLRNHLRLWSNGSQRMAPYYNRIKVTEAPRGDAEACKDCYEKSSITDVQACRDRRVDIIAVSVDDQCDPQAPDPPSPDVLTPKAPLALQVFTFNAITGEPLLNTTVGLSANNLPDEKRTNDKGHQYDYNVDRNTRYLIVGTKEGYTSSSETWLSGNETGTTEIVKLFLTPDIQLNTLTFDADTKTALTGVKVELELQSSQTSRHQIISTHLENTTHQYHHDVEFRKSYRIIASKQGYASDTVYVSTENIPVVPTILEKKLFLRKTGTTAPGFLILRVLTYHEITGEPLNGTSVKVSTDSDNTVGLHKTLNEHTWLYNVDWKTNYHIDAQKEGYSSSRMNLFTTPGKQPTDNTLEVKLYLRPTVDLTAFTFDRTTGKSLTGVQVDLILLPQKNRLSTQQEAKASKYDYPLDFSQRYMVVASHEDYSSDTSYVNTTDITVETTHLETKLYLCKNLQLTPGISLYFDNDHPDPDTEKTTTDKSYDQTCNAYIDNRNYYESKFSTGSDAHTEMKSFFDEEVAGGMARLDAFAQQLYNYFSENGNKATKVDITIQGHASKRSNSRYNLALTKRRVNSLKNYLRNWNKDGQQLTPYYHRIQIVEVPKGENEAQQHSYQESAIRDIQACKDRRVDIISATVINSCPPTKPKRPSGSIRE